MELQFNKTVCPCLRRVISQVQTQEQTQEVRLPDAMPDIGKVLGCWGQVLIRGKEWRSGGMNVSGGVMAWVLYAPEDGTGPRSLDTWIPFQMKWEFPDTQRDGTICVMPRLMSMDARSVSARKVMLRAGLSVLGEALEPVQTEVFLPDGAPEDVQLLRQVYPMELPQEAGEKDFQMDEEVPIGANSENVRKIIRYSMDPGIAEQKVVSGKLVFRGSCALHMLYASGDGSLHTWDGELPFSQFTDLDREYGNHAVCRICAVPTGMELDTDEEGKLHMKCGIAAQYVVYDRTMVEVVEDAYSPQRKLNLHTQELRLPVLLDTHQEQVSFHHSIRAEGQRILDAAAFWEHPAVRQSGDSAQAEAGVQYQVLYYDENGSLQSAGGRSEETWSLPSDRNNDVQIRMEAGRPVPVFGADAVEISGELRVEAFVTSERGISMVTALELGEQETPDQNRPSLILRRAGECRLWDLAKECGSTVDAIRQANRLQQEPAANQVLLIPVL